MTEPFALAQLEDWEFHGATWRVVELRERRVVLELCTCSGEPVDRVESKDPKLIEYVTNGHLRNAPGVAVPDTATHKE